MAITNPNRYRNIKHSRQTGEGRYIGRDLLAPENWTPDPITGCWLWNHKYASLPVRVRHSGRDREIGMILAGVLNHGIDDVQWATEHEPYCGLSCINPEHLTMVLAFHPGAFPAQRYRYNRDLRQPNPWYAKFSDSRIAVGSHTFRHNQFGQHHWQWIDGVEVPDTEADKRFRFVTSQMMDQ